MRINQGCKVLHQEKVWRVLSIHSDGLELGGCAYASQYEPAALHSYKASVDPMTVNVIREARPASIAIAKLRSTV